MDLQRCGYVMRSNYNGYNTYLVLSGGAVAPPAFCYEVSQRQKKLAHPQKKNLPDYSTEVPQATPDGIES